MNDIANNILKYLIWSFWHVGYIRFIPRNMFIVEGPSPTRRPPWGPIRIALMAVSSKIDSGDIDANQCVEGASWTELLIGAPQARHLPTCEATVGSYQLRSYGGEQSLVLFICSLGLLCRPASAGAYIWPCSHGIPFVSKASYIQFQLSECLD